MKIGFYILFHLGIILITLDSWAEGTAFRVRFSPDRMEVDIPGKAKEASGLYVENKMMIPLRAKLVNEKGEIVAHMAMRKGEFFDYSQKINTKDKLVLIPLAPPFQEVQLTLGAEDYEIPHKR